MHTARSVLTLILLLVGGSLAWGQATEDDPEVVEEPPIEQTDPDVEEPTEDDELDEEIEDEDELRPYGYAIFEQARELIELRRRQLLEDPEAIVDGTRNLITPGIAIPVPERYQLGPGDELLLRLWSPFVQATDYELTLDPDGGINLPNGGPRINLRGLTMEQAESMVDRELKELVNEPEFTLTLAELRTMSISVIGEAFAPGVYEVPAVATLFNTLRAIGGPSDVGSLRGIELRRTGRATVRFDLYSWLLSGENDGDVTLLPGDVIYVPPVGSRVTVDGQVFRPAIYEVRPEDRLQDVLDFAGGVRPSGVAQRVSVRTVEPGVGRTLRDVDVTSDENPPIFDGDHVEVYPVREEALNAVFLEGDAVDQPGDYALTDGMRVSDLIARARGLLREAAPRADLFRRNDDGTTALVRVDLRAALNGDIDADLELRRDDRLRVYRRDEIEWLEDRLIVVEGAVNAIRRANALAEAEFEPIDEEDEFEPETEIVLERSDGMTVTDAILQAGGLAPDAFREGVLVQRTNADGTPGPLVTVDLDRAIAGDPEHDVALMDRDRILVPTVAEATYVAPETVEILGAVQAPGAYDRASDMTLSELVRRAGNVLPDAFMDRAFVQRFNPDGTVGALLTVDLGRALAGDVSQDVALEDGDRVSVYFRDEAMAVVPQIVAITGAVQRSGSYPRAEDMRLSDLIRLAGMTLPNANTVAQIGRARVPVGTQPQTFDIESALDGSNDPLLQDGDLVTITSDSQIEMEPVSVTLAGAVLNPGPYIITRGQTRLSDILGKAGGFTDFAFLNGAQFFRDPERLQTQAQNSITPRLREVIRLVNDLEYTRALGRSEIDKLEALRNVIDPGLGAVIGGTSTPQPEPTEIPQGSKIFEREIVTMARQFSDLELTPDGNVNVDFVDALRKPGGINDVMLEPGDVIVVPERPTTVAVTGAVVVPSALIYQPGWSLGAYIDRAGGLTPDAGVSMILIVRANGTVERADRNTRIELGDVIYVPSMVVAERLQSREADLNALLRNVGSVGLFIAAAASLFN